jgi:hypothetical protein
MRAFAEALDAIPMALAENSGLSPIETLAAIKSRQVKEKNTRLGVDCMQTGSNGKPHLPILSKLQPTISIGPCRSVRDSCRRLPSHCSPRLLCHCMGHTWLIMHYVWTRLGRCSECPSNAGATSANFHSNPHVLSTHTSSILFAFSFSSPNF